MKKVLFFALGTALLVCTSFTAPSLAPARSTATATTVAQGAPPEHWNEHKVMEYNEMAYWECVGEWIEVDATMYILNTGVESPNKSISAWNVRWKGTGVGLTSGTEYIINEHDNSVFNISNKNGQITWNGQHKFNMISPGSGANISAQWNIQWVLNAKGIPVIESFEDPELACR